jgi:hypothetical protein
MTESGAKEQALYGRDVCFRDRPIDGPMTSLGRIRISCRRGAFDNQGGQSAPKSRPESSSKCLPQAIDAVCYY